MGENFTKLPENGPWRGEATRCDEASPMSGCLLLVATPIGNLGDLTPRAIEALESADRILCEDTRRTRILLSACSLRARGRLEAFHDHNEAGRVEGVLRALRAGETVVLVSDAGTPGISDPGERLVAAVAEAGLTVTALPGASAVLAALVVSGLPTQRFAMEGFLERKGSPRAAQIAALGMEQRTTVLFESPKRLAATLSELAAALGEERRVCVARELTKLHEQVWRGTLGQARDEFALSEVRGEIVLVLDGAAPPPPREVDDDTIVAALRDAFARGLSARDAASEAAEILGVPRRRAYELANQERDES